MALKITRYNIGSTTIITEEGEERITLIYNAKRLPQHCYKDNKKLKEISLPKGVEIIGANAFEGCTELTTIEIPSKVHYIGPNAFIGCENLTDVILDESINVVELIGNRGVYSFIKFKPFTDLVKFLKEGYSAKLYTDYSFSETDWR